MDRDRYRLREFADFREKYSMSPDAEQQQYLRDHHLGLEAKVEKRVVEEDVLVVKTKKDAK